MTQPSPKAHLVRLAIVIGGALVVFLGLKHILTPSTWDFKNWYRGEEALTLNKNFPTIYGGNDSCAACHEDVNKEVAELRHQQLSCESCHGALADHVKDGEKTGDAVVMTESNWQCLNSHEARVTKPAGFPQFDRETIAEHKEMETGMVCIACHAPHDPTP
jgi:hypothetical protein